MSNSEISVRTFNAIAALVDESFPRPDEEEGFPHYARQYLRGALYGSFANDDADPDATVGEFPATVQELEHSLRQSRDELFSPTDPMVIDDPVGAREASEKWDTTVAAVLDIAG